MKRDLTYYLKHPERISELSEAEINAWFYEYPYAQSIKWLKARYDLDLGLPTMKESVLSAAAASDDLVFLRYQLLHDSSKVSQLKSNLIDAHTIAEKESLSKSLANEDSSTVSEEGPSHLLSDDDFSTPTVEENAKESVGLDISDEVSPEAKEISSIEEHVVLEPKDEIIEEVKEEANIKVDDRSLSKEIAKSKSPPVKEKIILGIKPTEEMKARQVDDLLSAYSGEISGFSKWLLAQDKEGFSSSKQASGMKNKSSKKKKKKSKKKSKLEKLIDHSIVEREGVISETYANLLATQGYTQKAIELYQRLMLKFPEKSGYFAAKIEELQK